MIEYQMKYQCPNCGRKWTALDSVRGPAVCRCSTKVTPVEVQEYSLYNCKHWQFWDQVDLYEGVGKWEGYGGSEPSVSDVPGERARL